MGFWPLVQRRRGATFAAELVASYKIANHVPDWRLLLLGFLTMNVTQHLRVLALSAIGLCNSLFAQQLTVTHGNFSTTFLMTGELVAEEAVRLTIPFANIWPVTIRWIAEDGVKVDPGEVVAEFDNSSLTSELIEKERTVEQQELELQALKARTRSEELRASLDLERKQSAWEKAKLDATVPASLLASQDYERRQLDMRRAQLAFNQAQQTLGQQQKKTLAEIQKQSITLEKARRSVAQAKNGIDRLALTAPKSGVLLIHEHPQEGRTFQAGDSSWPGVLVASLPDLSTLMVNAWLFDVDAGRVESGMRVTASIDAFPELELEGEIVEVQSFAEAPKPGSSQRRFQVRARLKDLDPSRMRPGMSVKLMVHTLQEKVLVIPRSTLFFDASQPGKVVMAHLVNGKDTPVELGSCNRSHCVLLAGLDIGAKLMNTDLGQ